MNNLRTIEVDLAIHIKIETERNSFEESPNSILRRLLNIDSEPLAPSTQSSSMEHSSQPNGRAWSGKGVILPHGTEVRMEYKGSSYIGKIDNGKWLIKGQSFNAPSPAALHVASLSTGKAVSLNGWIHWEIRLPGDTSWRLIDKLRYKKHTRQN